MAEIYDYSSFLLADRVMRLFQDQALSHASFMLERKQRQQDQAGIQEWQAISNAIARLQGRQPKGIYRKKLWDEDFDAEKVIQFEKSVDIA